MAPRRFVAVAFMATVAGGAAPMGAIADSGATRPGGPHIEGTVSCPTPAAVKAELLALLPALREAEDGRAIQLTRDGARLRLSMRAADGRVVAQKFLAATAACPDLAKAAAVVIASWHLELGEDLATPGLPALSLPSLAPPPAPPPPSALVELGAGAAVLLDPDDALSAWRPGAQLGMRRFSGHRRLGLWAEVVGFAPQRRSLAGGQATFRRTFVSLGPVWRWGPERAAAVDVALGAAAGWFSSQGQGFSRDHAVGSFDPGAAFELRGSLRAGRFRPWVSAQGTAWLVGRHLDVAEPAGKNASRQLSRFAAHLSVGVDFRLQP